MGEPGLAANIAREALAGAADFAPPAVHAKLRAQLGEALSSLNRFAEAEPNYKAAAGELEDEGDFDGAARILSNLGGDALEANRLDEAESALSRALWIVTIHHVNASDSVLLGLAKVKARNGNLRSAESLFDAAIDAPPGLSPRWLLYADRGRFRLDHGDLNGALQDFREAHRLAMLIRADIVPADQDRIALESGLNRVGAGLVEAGNRIAQRTGNRRLLAETFDTAEQDHLWSLRALVPAPNDWRTRLPNRYWDLLAHYQALERDLMTRPAPETERAASALQLELRELEAAAGPGAPQDRAPSALTHAKSILDADTVLFSFSLAESGGWLWAVDRQRLDVYPVPSTLKLKASVAEFVLAERQGYAGAAAMGNQLYKDLFGKVGPGYLAHKRWLLELDGPLFDLPFAALVVDLGVRKNEPIYLVERAALQAIPGALMLQPRTSPNDGQFLGIGDPVYNVADERYRGNRRAKQDLALPRLIATGEELKACARAAGSTKTRILTGEDADLITIQKALLEKPAVVHFATHIVTSPGSHPSGLIALSLDRSGAMELMGPAEIVTRPVSADLVVLNGCHSSQGETLPGSGLMGLTRAWIGAGAKAVLATSWDIPDEGGKAFMTDFYLNSKAHPDRAPAFALQHAQLMALKGNRTRRSESTATWAAYFLLARE
jgi:hypothetical protein